MAAGGGISVEDALYRQARDVQGKEFEEWVSKVKKTLELNDRGSNCLTLLRQLYILTAVTKYPRNISSSVYELLQSVILEPEQGPLKLRLLAAAILQELAPSGNPLVRDFAPPVEERNVQYLLPVYLAQGNSRDQLSLLTASHIFRWLTQLGNDDDLQVQSLSSLHVLLSHPRSLEHLTEEQLRAVGNQLSGWLRHASRSCLPAPTSSSISLFSSGSKKQQMQPVKEIDGSTSPDIFTILSLGGHYSHDQLLNIRTFSLLCRWFLMSLSASRFSPSPSQTPTSDLRPLSRVTPSPGPVAGRSSLTSLVSSLPSPLPPSSHPSPTTFSSSMVTSGRGRQSLRDAAVLYCLRVVDQCERKPTKSSDEELTTACLYECISLLDVMCSLSSSLVHGVFPIMRKLFARYSGSHTHSRLLLSLVRFFLHHGSSEMYDIEIPIRAYFGQVLTAKFNNPGVAYDTVEFLLGNVEMLLNASIILSKYVPNILKILAWSPMTFVAEFLQLLPAFISQATASEVLHSLFDLPCLSATLQAQHLIDAVPNITDLNLLPRYNRCLASFQDAAHKLMFGHFLRSETGRGDTIDRLGNLHLLLSDFSSHQRVLAAAQVAPELVRMFFKVVLHAGDIELISQLVPVLIERTVLLYSIPSFQDEMRKVISEQLLAIFGRYPQLVVDYSRDIIEYLKTLRNLTQSGEHCYIHLVWILGEYTHLGYDSRCTSSLLVELFETLEPVTYEVALNLHRETEYSTRLVLVLMSSLAKIASRSQDLISRALLCLNKIVQLGKESSTDSHTHQTLLIRANELVNVLKNPSIASAVLSPAPRGPRPQQQLQKELHLARLLQATSLHLDHL